MHLLIPYAKPNAAQCQQALAALKLPNLGKLLRALPLAHADVADETTLSPPHERAQAAAYGITGADGLIPWGAWHAAQAGHSVLPGQAWAVVTPCHWAVQTSHITMTHPRALNLGEDESRALLAAMQGYFAEDGIALLYDTPTRWLAQGDVFAGLATASPYRVVGSGGGSGGGGGEGSHVDHWLPKAAAAKNLRRLQQEMQMLLYTHPLTDARTAQGLPAINSFWVSGTGALAAASQAAGGKAQATQLLVPNTLRDAAVRQDWAAWAQAWQHIDATECAAVLAHLQGGGQAKLTLCGERSAHTFGPAPQPAFKRVLSEIRHTLAPKPSYLLRSEL